MTMMLYSTNRKKNNNTALTLSALVVVIFLLIVFQGFVRETVLGAAGVFLNSEPRTSVYALVPRSELIRQLVDAEEELSRIRYQAFLYERAVQENIELLTFTGLRRADAYTSGSVLSVPPRTHYDTILVSVPQGAIPHVGDFATLSEMLLGTVTRVSGRVVEVTLLSAPGAGTDARVQGDGVVVLRGTGGGGFLFDVPAELLLESGDIIRSADGAFVLAVVSTVHVSPERTSARVVAHAPVSLQRLFAVEFVRALSEE